MLDFLKKIDLLITGKRDIRIFVEYDGKFNLPKFLSLITEGDGYCVLNMWPTKYVTIDGTKKCFYRVLVKNYGKKV